MGKFTVDDIKSEEEVISETAVADNADSGQWGADEWDPEDWDFWKPIPPRSPSDGEPTSSETGQDGSDSDSDSAHSGRASSDEAGPGKKASARSIFNKLPIDKEVRRRIIAAFIITLLLGLIVPPDFLYRLDLLVSDNIYQSSKPVSERILIVGIDGETTEALGPYSTWSREIIADALGKLNSSSETAPAVIGLTLTFPGYGDEKQDRILVESAASRGNVVLSGFVEPFPELKAVTRQGGINYIFDSDGVIRHNLLYIDAADGEKIPGFAYSVATLYEEKCSGGQADSDTAFKLELPVLDDENCWYVPYSGKLGAFDSGVSFIDLIHGNYEPDLFAGRIVLIGAYTGSSSDQVITSIDRSVPMYGVEYQANVLNALLNHDYKQELPLDKQYLLFFIIIFLCALGFAFNFRTGVYVVILLGLVTAYSIHKLYQADFMVYVLRVPLAMVALCFIAAIYGYSRAIVERRKTKKVFLKYVDPKVATEMLTSDVDDIKLGGEKLDIAVIFVSIRNFRQMSTAMKPSELVQIVNRYLNITSGCIIRHDGMLDKFMGDVTMGLFNAPFPQEDYVHKAILAALEILEESRPINEEILRVYNKSVSLSIGVNCGPAIVGNVGSTVRMEYTAIGDTVNTASRLEGAAQGGEILVSRAVLRALGDRIIAEPLDRPVKLKGKSDAFEVFKVKGLMEG